MSMNMNIEFGPSDRCNDGAAANQMTSQADLSRSIWDDRSSFQVPAATDRCAGVNDMSITFDTSDLYGENVSIRSSMPITSISITETPDYSPAGPGWPNYDYPLAGQAAQPSFQADGADVPQYITALENQVTNSVYNGQPDLLADYELHEDQHDLGLISDDQWLNSIATDIEATDNLEYQQQQPQLNNFENQAVTFDTPGITDAAGFNASACANDGCFGTADQQAVPSISAVRQKQEQILAGLTQDQQNQVINQVTQDELTSILQGDYQSPTTYVE